jgi:pyruvate dehydrogenase E2 component (dihydrolipoamide acetyltransferase)
MYPKILYNIRYINIVLDRIDLTEILKDNQLPLTRIQKLIGHYMLESKRSKANGYLRMRADLTDLVAMRKAYCREVKVRVTTNDFFIYAMAQAVKQYPLMAATITPNGEEMVITKDIGVGFAVAAPQGLVVPVLKEMNHKTLPQTAVESEDLLKRARANKLLPNDFDGANIVLTGLGMYGIESFYAISPPSATGILAIGNIEDTLVPSDHGFKTRRMMYVSLAFDQRVMDEFYAAKFLRMLVDLLEAPTTLIGQTG